MCGKVETALEMMKQRKTLTKGEIVMVFQQVVYDLKNQGERMTNLENEVSSLKEETRTGFDEVNQKLNRLTELVEIHNNKKTFWDRIPLLKEIPTWFWIILWSVVMIIGGLLKVAPDFAKYIPKGG